MSLTSRTSCIRFPPVPLLSIRWSATELGLYGKIGWSSPARVYARFRPLYSRKEELFEGLGVNPEGHLCVRTFASGRGSHQGGSGSVPSPKLHFHTAVSCLGGWARPRVPRPTDHAVTCSLARRTAGTCPLASPRLR